MACLLIFSAGADAQQRQLGGYAGINARVFQGQNGRLLTFVCPATAVESDYVWGTDTYTDDSRICVAAIHAGVLPADRAGVVTIVMGAGVASFQGSARNGVTSQNYGSWDSTFTFSRTSEPGQIDWFTTALYVPAEYRDPVNVVCPPDGNLETNIWGTDVYTASSSICVAAVHAGAVTQATGGKVTVIKVPAQETFVETVRNGVTSHPWTGSNYRDYPDPFAVTPNAITANVPASPGTRSGPIPKATDLSRTIDLTGITAAGTSMTIAPRTIDLPGITAIGTSTTVPPRTIDLPGITAIGTSTAVPPRTIDLPAIIATGTFPTAASRTITLADFTASGAPAKAASRTIALNGFSGSGVPQTAASRTISLAGFTGSGVPVAAASRSIVLAGWAGSGQ
jgi:hypothetical protein